MTRPPLRSRSNARLALARSLLLALPVFFVASCGGKGGEASLRKSDAPFSAINKAFQPLRTDFEAEAGKIRLLGVVTPTCGECLESVQALQNELLPRANSEDLVVFLVWVGVLPTDVEPRLVKVLAKLPDERIRHYWDESGRFARALGQQMGLESGRNVYNVFYLYGRNATWDPDLEMTREPADYNALLEGWQPAPPRYRMGEHMAVRIPMFSINDMAREILKLEAEPSEPPSR